MNAMIIPPTIRNTSSEILKMAKNLEPNQRGGRQNNQNAEGHFDGCQSSLRRRKLVGVNVRKIEPHTTGLMTAKTVTTACTIW